MRWIQRLPFLRRRPAAEPELPYFVLNILDHCNLRCRGCDHFAAIARPRFVALQDIESDLARIAELLDGRVGRIGIMGGEPLLHPDLLRILAMARSSFPETTLQLVTNGILLRRQAGEFWDVCRREHVVVVMTRYPIGLDYDAIMATAGEHQVEIDFRDEGAEKQLYRIPLDLSGGQDPEASFSACFHAGALPLVMEGRMYACTIAPNVRIFNERFGTRLPVSDGDSIGLRDASRRELLEFLGTPKPFCRYCDVAGRSFGHPWERSRRQMEEWVR